jgi:3-phenylpropionate/cinnamic acid dioxygenase small subunit
MNDREQITDLISRLGRWLDDKQFDDSRSVLTEDVTVSTPGGQAEGLERVVAQASRNHQVPTQHLITNVLVDIDGDTAAATANLLVTFARDTLDQQGERYRFDAARTPEGWRLRRIEVTPIWRSA